MKNFKNLFSVPCPVIGMIHLQALPGTPGNRFSPAEIVAQAIKEAKCYINCGIDGIMIENMHDIPYLNKNVGPEIVASMAIIAQKIRKLTPLPLGIQILAAANQEAVAVAKMAGLDFIRAEGFVFGHLADEGWIDAQAGPLLRYRKQIDADGILVFTDIKKKHSAHEISKDVSLEETAKAAQFFKSNGVIITGTSTARPADVEELKSLRNKLSIPVLVGSGITLENVHQYFPICDGLIVGSYFKENGHWESEPDAERVKDFMVKINGLRAGK